jgi:hypothetical protein
MASPERGDRQSPFLGTDHQVSWLSTWLPGGPPDARYPRCVDRCRFESVRWDNIRWVSTGRVGWRRVSWLPTWLPAGPSDLSQPTLPGRVGEWASKPQPGAEDGGSRVREIHLSGTFPFGKDQEGTAESGLRQGIPRPDHGERSTCTLRKQISHFSGHVVFAKAQVAGYISRPSAPVRDPLPFVRARIAHEPDDLLEVARA